MVSMIPMERRAGRDLLRGIEADSTLIKVKISKNDSRLSKATYTNANIESK